MSTKVCSHDGPFSNMAVDDIRPVLISAIVSRTRWPKHAATRCFSKAKTSQRPTSSPPGNLSTMPDLADLYPGFASHWVDTSAGKIFVRAGGSGPPLMLLHGYAQTNAMWPKAAD